MGGTGDIEDALVMALELGPLARARASAPADVQPVLRQLVRSKLETLVGRDGKIRLPGVTWLWTARRP